MNGNDYNSTSCDGLPGAEKLLDSFFGGDISPEEAEVLFSMARRVAQDNSLCQDEEILRGLLLVDSLCSYRDFALGQFASDVPSDLESRLDEHISSLAATSSSSLLTRLIASLGAAAAVCAVVFAAWHISDKDSSLSAPEHSISIASVPSHESAPENTVMPAYASMEKISATNSGSSEEATHVRQHKPKKSHAIIPEPVPQKETAKASAEKVMATLPPVNDDRIRICPDEFKINAPLTDAAAEIDRLLLMPVSTLGESAENIRESIATVSEVFSAVAEALEIVNSSLTILPTPGKPI